MSQSFLAGAAVRSIMPSPQIVDNTLHALMTVRFDESGSPPHAKALAMTLGRTSVMLIGLDLGGAHEPPAQPLREAVAQATDLEIADVVISCTHTHSAAMIEPLTGPHPYFDLVLQAAADAAAEAWASRRPAPVGPRTTPR